MLRHWAGQQPASAQIQHRGKVELALVGGDIGDVATPFQVRRRGSEVAFQQVRKFRRLLVLSGQALTPLWFSTLQALPAHGLRDRVHTDLPALLEQVGVDARRTVAALGGREQLGHPRVQLGAATLLVGGFAVCPLVEPGDAHAQDGAARRVWHPVEGPLVGDEAGHAHFVASFTHRTTDRLRTSRSIRSSATSARSRFNSATSPVERPCVPSRSARSLATQLPRVPWLIPRSRATWAIGLPVSRTMRTAPSRNSGSNFLRVSGIPIPHSACLHGFGGGALNLVERWFAELTTKKLRRGAHTSVRQLNADIRAWIDTWNDNPRPYVWTKTADQILASISNYCTRINDSGH